MTLFSSIFFFVNTFPRPPAQPSSQFSAQLLYSGPQGATIHAIKVTHLAGPTLAPNTGILIYLLSSQHPTRFPTPFTLSSGLNGSPAWNLGQSWYLDLTTYSLTVGDNITVSIVSTTQLLFRVTLPGSNPILPPQFVAVGAIPASPTVGSAFSVYAQIFDPQLKANSVYANVSQIPGAGTPTSRPMTYSATTGQWSILLANGATAAGTFYIFVNASDNLSQTNSVAIPIVVGTGLIPPAGVSLSVNPAPPVNGTAATVYARVMNTGAAASTVNVTFRAGATVVGTASGPISAGGTAQFSTAWTPSTVGTVLLTAQANVSGGGSPTGALNVTVYPTVLLIAHGVAAGTRPANNTSAYLAQEVQAAGFPFTQMFVPCTSAIPNAAALGAYNLVIIDFGSAAGGACAATPSTTQQGYITSAMSSGPSFTRFLLVGADAFTTGACASYTAAFLADFGITGGGGTCFTASASATSALTYTGTPASGFRSDGVGSLTLNKTLAGSSGFRPYSYFTNGATHTFLKTASGTIGSWNKASGAGRGAALGTDPALIMSNLPAPTSQAWGVSGGATEVLFNALDYLAGLSTSTAAGHAMPDFAIAGATLIGISQSHLSYVYVTLRANGPIGGLVTVSLTVNGTIAEYNGQPVSSTVSVNSIGQDTTVLLTWQAPGVASYQLGAVALSFDGSLFATVSQLPLSVLNQATVFKA